MKTITDKEMESSVAGMLRFGVTVSALLVFLGGLLYLRNPWLPAPTYGHFLAERMPLRGIIPILRGAFHLDAKSVIQFGIFLLVATPIVRVAFCIVGFARQRDRLYVLISTSVFAILIYSFIQGGR